METIQEKIVEADAFAMEDYPVYYTPEEGYVSPAMKDENAEVLGDLIARALSGELWVRS